MHIISINSSPYISKLCPNATVRVWRWTSDMQAGATAWGTTTIRKQQRHSLFYLKTVNPKWHTSLAKFKWRMCRGEGPEMHNILIMINVTLQNDFPRDSHLDRQHSAKVSGPPILIFSFLSDIFGWWWLVDLLISGGEGEKDWRRERNKRESRAGGECLKAGWCIAEVQYQSGTSYIIGVEL